MSTIHETNAMLSVGKPMDSANVCWKRKPKFGREMTPDFWDGWSERSNLDESADFAAALRETDEALKVAEDSLALSRTLAERLREVLKRISRYEDAPQIDPEGDEQLGLHCGVEDRCCANVYDAADYGYATGITRGFEWARNEVRNALALTEADCHKKGRT